MSKKEITIKIFLSVISLVGILFLARYFYLNNQIEYRDLNKQPQEKIENENNNDLVFSKAVPKNEEEIEEDTRTSQTENGAEKPKEVTEVTQKDNIDFSNEENNNELENEINKQTTKDNLIIVPVKSASSDGRIYIEYNNNIYEISGISEKYLPIRKIAKDDINNYPVVYYDETKDIYFIYTNISEIKFLKINEKFLDESTKTYKGKVEEFIL